MYICDGTYNPRRSEEGLPSHTGPLVIDIYTLSYVSAKGPRRNHPRNQSPSFAQSGSNLQTLDDTWVVSLYREHRSNPLHNSSGVNPYSMRYALYDTLWDTEDLEVLSLTRVIRGKMSEIFIAPSKTQ